MSPDTVITVVHDTTRMAVDSLGHIVNVVVEKPTTHWWSSPLLQTLLGGVLALAGGTLAPIIQERLKTRKVRKRLHDALSTLNSLLLETWANVQRDNLQPGRVLYLVMEIKAMREGLDQEKDDLGFLGTLTRCDVLVLYTRIDPLIARVGEYAERLLNMDEADKQGQLMPTVSLRMTKDGLSAVAEHCERLRDGVKPTSWLARLRASRRKPSTESQ